MNGNACRRALPIELAALAVKQRDFIFLEGNRQEIVIYLVLLLYGYRADKSHSYSGTTSTVIPFVDIVSLSASVII